MKKAGKIMAALLLGVIIAVNLSTAVRNLTGASDGFSLLPFTLLSVTTGSMEPDLSAGDLIIDREISYEDLEIGDIISYQRNGEYITHRLVRFEGSRLITQGTANNAEDKSVGPEEYLGKVVAVLPGMGTVLSYFRNPVCMLCLLLVIAGLFYLPGIMLSADRRREEQKMEKETGTGGTVQAPGHRRPRPESVLRFCGFLAAVSFLVLTPTMTEAKYAAVINGRAALAADYRYMGSNLLSDGGAVMELSGWTGGTYSYTVSVKNSENQLKYNRPGQDLTYRFIVQKIPSREGVTYRTDYDLDVSTEEDITEASQESASDFAYSPAVTSALTETAVNTDKTYLLEGRDEGPAEEEFVVTVAPQEGVTYALGDTIGYKIFAVTSYRDGYYFCKTADVILVAAASGEFVINRTKSTSPGNAILSYRFQTGLYDGAEVRDVIVSWDSTELTINEYEGNAFEIIHNRHNTDSYFAGDADDHNAYLVLPLSAYTTIELEFFKMDISSDGTDIEITAEVREEDTDTGSGQEE